MTQTEFIEFLKAEVQQLGSAVAVARKFGVSVSYLYDVLHSRCPASANFCKAFGFVRSVKITRYYTYKWI